MSRAKSRVQLAGGAKLQLVGGKEQLPAAKLQLPTGSSAVAAKNRINLLPQTAHQVRSVELDGYGHCFLKHTTQVKKELIKGVSKEKSVVGLSKAKSRGQLVIKKEIPKKTLSKTRSRAVLKDKNDPVSLITDDALDVRHNTKKKGEKEEEHQVNKVDAALHCLHLIRTIHIRIQITSLQSLHQVVRTPDEEERLSASVTAVVADHCYTTSPPVASTSKYSTSANAESQRTPKQTGQRVHSRSDISSSPSLESQPSCSFSHYKEPLLNHHDTSGSGSATSPSSTLTETSPVAAFPGRERTPWEWRCDQRSSFL